MFGVDSFLRHWSGCCCYFVTSSVTDYTLPGCYRSLYLYVLYTWRRDFGPIFCLVGETPLHTPGAILEDVKTCTGSGWISWEGRNAEFFFVPSLCTHIFKAVILHSSVGGSNWMTGIPDVKHQSIQSDIKRPTVSFWCLSSCMEQSFLEKLAVAQRIKKFSSSDVIWRFICVFNTGPHTEPDESSTHPLTLFL
jgi:hypothetical protein